MAPLLRLRVGDVNAHLVCVLCSGYFVDATSVMECLHTFCKACIVRYLQTSSFCPICDVLVHKTQPVLGLREDRTLQDIIYKLVPGLFTSEASRRSSFYRDHPEAVGDKTEQSLKERRHFFHSDDLISLSLELLPPTQPPTPPTNALEMVRMYSGHAMRRGSTEETPALGTDGSNPEETQVNKQMHKRYLKCPAAVQVAHLEKFIRLKFGLSLKHKVDMMLGEDLLDGELTLLDVVYMYKWAEDAPLRLTYSVSVPTVRNRKRGRVSRVSRGKELCDGAPETKVARVASPAVSTKDEKEDKDEESTMVIDESTCSMDENSESALSPVTPVRSDASKMVTFSSPVVSGPIAISNGSSTVNSTTGVCTVTTMSSSSPSVAITLPAVVSSPSSPVHKNCQPTLTTTQQTLSPATVTTTLAKVPIDNTVTTANSTITTKQTTVAVDAGTMKPNDKIPMVQLPITSSSAVTNSYGGTPTMPLGYRPPPPIIPSKPKLGRPPNASRLSLLNKKPAFVPRANHADGGNMLMSPRGPMIPPTDLKVAPKTNMQTTWSYMQQSPMNGNATNAPTSPSKPTVNGISISSTIASLQAQNTKVTKVSRPDGVHSQQLTKTVAKDKPRVDSGCPTTSVTNNTSNSTMTAPCVSVPAKSPTGKLTTVSAKDSPKSPNRIRGSGILSIAQNLANRQLQQSLTPLSSSSHFTNTMNNISTSASAMPQTAFSSLLGNAAGSLFPGVVGSGMVPMPSPVAPLGNMSPALAAYMASAYADPARSPEVAAMRNLITLSQTAAWCSMVQQAAEALPKASEPKPMDLSPTSKAAPSSPLANGGRSSVGKSGKSNGGGKSNSQSGSSTISPPTPEVTITKLPNCTLSVASATSTLTNTTKVAGVPGLTKISTSASNTVSITKRQPGTPVSSANRITVAKSPANASVRQIPNPSLLRHQSEARNNNNVPKSNGASKASPPLPNKGSGHSPLKESSPMPTLPETSSILKIENLTRSLAAGTPSPSPAFRFFSR